MTVGQDNLSQIRGVQLPGPGSDSSITGPGHWPAIADAIEAALVRGRPADAVRLFLRAIEEGHISSFGGGEIRTAAGTDVGESLLSRVLVACADFPCPYCQNGFVKCVGCDGARKVEGEFACARCFTLGATCCEFCCGSGRAEYAFFPESMQMHLVSTRVDDAIRKVGADLRAVIDAAAKKKSDERQLISRYAQLKRDHAMLHNAMEWLQAHERADRVVRARLAARCWRGLASSELALSQLLNRYCDLARARTADSEVHRDFTEDQINMLDREAAKLNRSACNRLTHLQTHQH